MPLFGKTLALAWGPCLMFGFALSGCSQSEEKSAKKSTKEKKEQVQSIDVSGVYDSFFGGAAVLQNGVLISTSGGAPITLELDQIKNKAHGSYEPVPGKQNAPPGNVNGTVKGTVLTGTWSDVTGATGGFELKFEDDASSFEGEWRSADLSGEWVGEKVIKESASEAEIEQEMPSGDEPAKDTPSR